MPWMESIRLRTGSSAQSEVRRIIGAFEEEMRDNKALSHWQFYRHATISGDFFILLHWEPSQVAREGSTLAGALVKMLSSTGVIDYCIWIGPNHPNAG